jgi:hypothetical protein
LPTNCSTTTAAPRNRSAAAANRSTQHHWEEMLQEPSRVGEWSICFPITAAREPTRSPPPSRLSIAAAVGAPEKGKSESRICGIWWRGIDGVGCRVGHGC